MAVRYTRHARYKFEVLERHGFPVTEQQVIEVLTKPDRVIPSRKPIHRPETCYRRPCVASCLPAGGRGPGGHYLLSWQEGAV